MTAGYFAPPSGSRSGVADYADSLRAALQPLCDLRLNRSGDINLYHVGNNQLHRPIYERALAEPGIVLLHDAVLHHFLLGYFAGAGPKSEMKSKKPGARIRYVEEFVYNYGEWHRSLAERLFDERARSGSDPRYFEYPMLRRITERAKLVIVHNRGAEAIVRAHASSARIERIPHLRFPAPNADFDRRRWKIPGSAFVFGVFGHLRETKRVSSVLRAFSEVRSELPGTVLVLAGNATSEAYNRLLDAPYEGVIRIGHTSEADFWNLAHSVDACVNLRYPAAGETSGVTVRLMEAGKPVLMTASADTTDFPEDACIRIDAGIREAPMLAACMRWLVQCPADARAIGTSAREHIRRHHGAAEIGSRFYNALKDALPE